MKKVKFLSLVTAAVMTLSSMPIVAQASGVSADEVNYYLSTFDYKTLDSGTLFTINKAFEKDETYEISFKVRSYEDTQRRTIRIWVGTSISTGQDKLCYRGALDGTTADGLPLRDGCVISSADGEGWYSVKLTYKAVKASDKLYVIVSGDTTSNNDKYNGSGVLPMDFDDFKLDGNLINGGDFSMGETTAEFEWCSFKTGDKVISLKTKTESLVATSGSGAASGNTGIMMILLKKKQMAEDSTEGTVTEETVEVKNSYLATDEYKTLDSGTLFTINQEFKKGETYDISFKVRSYENEQRRSIRIWAGTSTSTGKDKLCYRGALDGTTADGLPLKDGCEISPIDGEGWYLVNLTYHPENDSELLYVIVSGDTTSNNDKYNGSGVLPMDFDDFKLGGELLAGGDFSTGDASDEFTWASFKTGEKVINLKVKDETITVVGEAPVDDTADKDTDTEVTVESAR